jgi:hypothetical protein
MTPRKELTYLQVGLAILETLDPNEELTREELDLLAWRFEQLVEHGYDVEDAMDLARAKHVDLSLARRLTAERGCPPAIAAQILL